jgi:hypothetical protein
MSPALAFLGHVRQRLGPPALALRTGRFAPVLWAAAAFALLFTAFTAWVHHTYAGHFDGPFHASHLFGLPDAELAAGLRPVYPYSSSGWDGQFYYHLANDPFLRADTARHFDNPSYRAQRVGVPLLARALATLAGRSVVPPWLYHALQFGLTCLGFGVLTWWLRRQGKSPWYACAWLCGGGVQLSLPHGLLDAPADALFIAAFAALLSRRLAWYAVAAALLVLTREGFVVFPAAVFLATLCGRVAWDRPNYWARLAITALPGVVLLAWTGYVAWRLGISLLAPERNIPGLTSKPFVAFWQRLVFDAQNNLLQEGWLTLVTGATLAVLTALALLRARRCLAMACALPFLLLTCCLGTIIWHDRTGYLKCTSAVVALGVFLVPYARGRLLAVVLTAQALIGAQIVAERALYPFCLSPEAAALDTGPLPPRLPAEPKVLADIRSSVRWVNAAPEIALAGNYRGFWRFAHVEPVVFELEVTNLSAEPWPYSPRGERNEVVLGCRQFSTDGMHQEVLKLPKALGPGESCRVLWPQYLKPMHHQFVFSVVQCGEPWFSDRNPEYGCSHVVKVTR